MPAPFNHALIPFRAQHVPENASDDAPETLIETMLAGAALDNPENDAIHARIEARVLRCLRAILTRIGRDHERCGKAACLRARRCRGLACDMRAVTDDDEGDA
jgi:hypothetical protein